MAAVRDRVKELRRVPANQLVAHPQNWRRHPEAQIQAFRGALHEIGFSTAAICRELPDGRLQLLDGHLRAETMGTQEIPCLILDLDEEEAKKFLATVDPIGSLADADVQQLSELMSEFELEDAALNSMLDDLLLANSEGPQAPVGGPGANALVDKMALLPNEHYDYVLVLARTTHEWQELCYKLGIQKVRFPDRKRSVGVGRAILAEKVLKLLRSPDEIGGEPVPELTESTNYPIADGHEPGDENELDDFFSAE